MAAKHLSYFLFLFLIKHTKSISIHFMIPEITEKDFNMLSHLKYPVIWEYCTHRDEVCKSNNTNICALKIVEKKRFYKDFENGCFLFLSNMCDHPQEEYFIASGGTCADYISSRRDNDETIDVEAEVTPETLPEEELPSDTNSTDTNEAYNNTDGMLRQKITSSTLYKIDYSFDGHNCPVSCTPFYEPVCVNINRTHGKYFKMLNFLNHCLADVYYCKNWIEFLPPPNQDEMVMSSPLGWSYCGSSRYVQFARFSETASAMGHYGWLIGDYKYTHIMEPHQRIPGYGK